MRFTSLVSVQLMAFVVTFIAGCKKSAVSINAAGKPVLNAREEVDGDGSDDADLGLYCKKWQRPALVESCLLPREVTEASEMTFSRTHRAHFYVSNISGAAQPDGNYGVAAHQGIYFVNAAESQEGDEGGALRAQCDDWYFRSKTISDANAGGDLADVETMATGPCGSLSQGDECLYVFDSSCANTRHQRLLVFREPSGLPEETGGSLELTLLKSVYVDQDRQYGGAVIRPIEGTDEVEIFAFTSMVADASTCDADMAVRSNVDIVKVTSSSALATLATGATVTGVAWGSLPIATAVLAKVKSDIGGSDITLDSFALADVVDEWVITEAEYDAYLEQMLSLFPVSVRNLLEKVYAEGDLAEAEKITKELGDEGIEPSLDWIDSIELSSFHPVGFLYFTGITHPMDDYETFVIQTWAGPISFHYDLLSGESPGYLEFASNAKYRFNFPGMKRYGRLEQMESVIWVDNDFHKIDSENDDGKQRFWYSSERVPNFGPYKDIAAYDQSEVWEFKCAD